MITRRTKVQLVVFVVITLLGVTYVGARYARLDRLFYDDSYSVVAHFAESGGIYAGAEVSYRGVRVGQVDRMVVTDAGVDVHLDVEKDFDEIPRDALAVVGNRSALGEQYVELQPLTKGKPFLVEGSEIAVGNTRTPISTSELLTDVSNTVRSVDEGSLQTVVSELGLAFAGTGDDLAQIIDTSNRFIEAADANFEVTTALIRDANTVLKGQLASASAIRGFARDLSLFSTSLAGSDADLRRLIDSGGATATLLREFLEKNQVEITDLLNNLVTTGEVVVRHLDGLQMVLVVYPYVVENSFSVVARDPLTGRMDAHFGLTLTSSPAVCHKGYESTDRRSPQQRFDDPPMVMDAHCAEPASKTNARGAQNAPRPPVLGTYDPRTGVFEWAGAESTVPEEWDSSATLAPKAFGDDTWKWLFLQPLTQTQE